MTVTIIRHVKPGKEDEFEKLACQVSEAALKLNFISSEEFDKVRVGADGVRPLFDYWINIDKNPP